jgi:hypothetical protein
VAALFFAERSDYLAQHIFGVDLPGIPSDQRFSNLAEVNAFLLRLSLGHPTADVRTKAADFRMMIVNAVATWEPAADHDEMDEFDEWAAQMGHLLEAMQLPPVESDLDSRARRWQQIEDEAHVGKMLASGS